MAKRYSVTAKNYAAKVLSGKIPAGKYVRLACQRFIDDLNAKKSDYFYDNKAAAKACGFIELQYHTKGKWLRQKKTLDLEPWQVFFVCNIFGWKRKKNNKRRYSEAFLMVPRKNGKSQLAAAIALYMLCADGEGAPEVYCGATTEKQANEVFEPAQVMARKNEDMAEYYGIDVRASNINIPNTGAKMERLIGNPGDGGSPSCAVVDEYHEHGDDRLYSTMETGTMAREQPLILITTTAGSNLAGPCYALQLEAQKDLDGSVDGSGTIFSLIYGIDEGDDWGEVDTLKKANPNFGVSVVEDVILGKLANAKQSARKQSDFKTKHLNIWVGSMNAFFNVERWNGSERKINIEEFYGRRAYIGLDLASKVDIAALEMVIPLDDGSYARFGKYYLPEAAIESASNDHYGTWAKEGWITLTDGELIDFNEIKDDIIELSSLFELAELAYDPFQATMLVTELMAEGVPVVEFRPTVQNFSEPMKQMDGLIRAKRIIHNGDPVFTWMLSNVVAKADAKDNVYPRKEREENKIDGPIAHMSALGRIMNDDSAPLNDYLDNPISATIK